MIFTTAILVTMIFQKIACLCVWNCKVEYDFEIYTHLPWFGSNQIVKSQIAKWNE